MTKSKQGTLSRADMSDSELLEYYKESALDALLYWTNSTVGTIGANGTLTLLTEMLATGIEHLVPSEQADRAEDVIFHTLEQSFDIVRSKTGEEASPGEKKNKVELN
jgi:hypothetical protein